MLVHGPVGCGKSTWLQECAQSFHDYEIVRIAPTTKLHDLSSRIDWITTLENKRVVFLPNPLAQCHPCVYVLDDIHRIDSAALLFILEQVTTSKHPHVILASCLDHSSLQPAVRDRFDLGFQLDKNSRQRITHPLIPEAPPVNLDTLLEIVANDERCNSYAGHRAALSWMRAAQALACTMQCPLTLAHLECTREWALAHRHVTQKNSLPPSAPPASPHTTTSAKNFSNHAGQGPKSPPSLPPLRSHSQTHFDTTSLWQALRRTPLSSPIVRAKHRHTRRKSEPDWMATLVKGLPWQRLRGWTPGQPFILHRDDFVYRTIDPKLFRILMIVIDASGSMHHEERIALGKQLSENLVDMAYTSKDRVGLAFFHEGRLKTILAPGKHWQRLRQDLQLQNCAGRSPLAEMFRACFQYGQSLQSDPSLRIPDWIFVSDFRPTMQQMEHNSPIAEMLQACQEFQKLGHNAHVIDAENQRYRLGLGKKVAQILHATYHPLLRIANPMKEKA